MISTWRRHLAGMAAAMLGAGCAQGAEPVRIGWVYAMANAPVLIAEADGSLRGPGA